MNVGRNILRTMLSTCTVVFGVTVAHAAEERLIRPEEWQAYAQSFLAPSGRIVDTANGGISHSEGQGYGLILAYLAGMQTDFERIWRFTKSELLIRDDGLAAWKWDPNSEPRITDINNASDGEILIAYALAHAGAEWANPEYTIAAIQVAEALGQATLQITEGGPLLLPGVNGFTSDDRPDGPVVNLSYWVFEAFPVLAALDRSHDWMAVSAFGERLVRSTKFGVRQLPPDWLSLASIPNPAKGFEPEFGYNGLRIPLYLIRAGKDDPATLARFVQGMSIDGDIALSDLETDRISRVLDEPGYKSIVALMGCVLGDGPIPSDLTRFTTTNYYPSTLHLLVLSHARKELPQCL
ncbi:glycosyl hydrolase family 8 [Amaricoccus macauensis]|uniref:glycosyl hydrolase family 8 n=1 Tax=Amaricoccus macauensis TaxID=57001 RepID=UPI003C79C9FF